MKRLKKLLLFVCMFFFVNLLFSQKKRLIVKFNDSLILTKNNLTIFKSNQILDSLITKYYNEGIIELNIERDVIEKTLLVNLSPKKRIENIKILIPKEAFAKALFNKLVVLDNTKDYCELSVFQYPKFIKSLLIEYKKNGYPFVEIKPKQLKLDKKILWINLDIKTNDKRRIDKIVVKGYDKFPKKYLKRYKNNLKTVFYNDRNISNIDNFYSTLSFVEKIKSPEILFKKDSTIVYVFLKKKSSNSFDGLLGFSNAESTKISLNGYVNLKLDNIFDRGNTFQFNWQKDSQNRNELQLKAYTPYMYNSILSNTANFTLLKKDSTYLNTSFKEHLILPFKNNHNIYLLYNFQSSIVLLKDAVYNVQDYKRNLFGIGYSYKKPSIYLFEPYLFGVDVSYVFGNRSTKNYNQKQKEINFTSFYNFKVSKKIVLATKLIFKGLFSDDLLDNELYLLGGNETLRGYKNLSVSADKYSILHVDLNFYPNNYSKFYILSDYGVLSFIRKSNKIMSFGLGYSYKVAKNNQLDINYVLSKENNNSFKNAVLGIGFITYF